MAHLVRTLEFDRRTSRQKSSRSWPTPTPRFRALHREEMEHGSQIFKAANDQISALLTPESKGRTAKDGKRPRKNVFRPHACHGDLPTMVRAACFLTAVLGRVLRRHHPQPVLLLPLILRQPHLPRRISKVRPKSYLSRRRLRAFLTPRRAQDPNMQARMPTA